MIYYARSKNDRGETETVVHHLNRAGELCAQFLLPAGLSEWGQVLGTVHDIGKFSESFQLVLQGKSAGVNHALPAAVLLQNMYRDRRREANLLSAVAASHHSSLRCFGDYKQEIQNSLRGEGRNTDRDGRIFSLFGPQQYRQAATEWSQSFSKLKLPHGPDFQSTEDPQLSEMLFERFLFSALIDADWCSAAEHFDPDYLAQHTGPALDAEDAMDRLLKIRKEKQNNSTAADSLNGLRDELFDSCLAAGKDRPGLYTLTAPTGLGKTLALMAFALQQCIHWGKRRIVLILPYLAIIDQNGKDYREVIPNLLEIHSNVHWSEDAKAMAERWDAPCIVTTNVSFFEPLFSAEPGVCRHLHQFANSVIVLDEAQSLPVDLLDATLRTVKLLCDEYGCTAVFSTATQPSYQYRPGLDWHPKEIAPEVSSLFAATRRVIWDWRLNAPLSFDALAAELSEIRQCCVIVNLKRHARTLLEQVNHLRPEEEVFYLTTDLCSAHRSDLLKTIRDYLRDDRPCCLIATQCIEAGVDLDFPVLYRAMAPLESLIQAAGRCNRNGDGPNGRVTVFIPDDDGKPYPSEEYGRGALCTLNLLARHGGSIDCNDISLIDEYYQLLYGGGGRDRKALRDAIQDLDYTKTENQYKMIDQKGVQVIVPYAERLNLYEKLKDDLDRNGLTQSVLRAARTLIVSCYDKENVEQYCINLKYRSKESGQLISTGYYLLDLSQFYDDKRGLYWDNIFDGIF